MSDEDREEDSLENTLDAESDDDDTTSEADKAEARRKDAQEYARQLSEQLKESNHHIATLEGRVEELSRSKTEPDPEPVKSLFDIDEDTRDAYRDDPAKLIDFQEEQFNTIANAFVNSQQQTAAQIRALEARIADSAPEKQAWKGQIEELKSSEPALAGLTDEQAIAVLKGRGTEPSYSYPGGGEAMRGGGPKGRLRESDLKPSKEEYATIVQSFLALSGGDEKRAKARADRFVKQKQEEAKAGARL